MINLFRKNKEELSTYERIARWMWILAIAAMLGTMLVFLGLSFSDLPSIRQLENPKSEEATQVFAANGEVIGRYYTENRVPVSYDQLSPHLVNALIATEDERYHEHCGIDYRAWDVLFSKQEYWGKKAQEEEVQSRSNWQSYCLQDWRLNR